MKKAKLFLLTILSLCVFATAHAQTKEVTGVVYSTADDKPIMGASVFVVDNSKNVPIIGDITNLDGKFKLDIPLSTTHLKISSIGFEDQTVKVNFNGMKIYLRPSQEELNKVVVVAYGKQSKNSLTGSATKVDLGKVATKSAGNISTALEGVAPGVRVFSSGRPGDDATIQIRGIGSLNSSTAPLYVVDGIPLGLSLNSVDPADIESVTILKDASASALYGSRASNGVIIVTTKQGKQGKVSIQANVKGGINMRLIPLYDVISNPNEYIEYQWLGLKNRFDETKASNYLLGSDYGIPEMYNIWNLEGKNLINPQTGKLSPDAKIIKPRDSWEKELFRIGKNIEGDINISGGNNGTSFYTSLGYQINEGYLIASSFNKFNIRNNIRSYITPNLKLTSNLSYSASEDNGSIQSSRATNNGFAFVNGMPSIYPVYQRDSSGNKIPDPRIPGRYAFDYGKYSGVSRAYAPGINPVGSAYLDIDRSNEHNLSSNLSAEYTFIKHFKFNLNYGLQVSFSIDKTLINPYYGDSEGEGGIEQETDLYVNNTFNQLLSYNNKWGIHELDVLFGHESLLSSTSISSASNHKILAGNMAELNNAILSYGTPEGYTLKYSMESYFANLKYSYNDKWYLNGSIRLDGTSRFAPGHKWGVFGSGGLAYIMSNENFLRSVKWLDNLKFKASFGVLGNQSLSLGNSTVNQFPYMDLWRLVNAGDKISLQFFKKGNPNLTWERSSMFNIGTEGSIFGGVLTWDIEYFFKKTYDMVYSRNLSPSQGIQSIVSNAGSLVNHGVEFNLNIKAIKTKDWNLTFNVNGGWYKNFFASLTPDSDGKPKQYEINDNYVFKKGHELQTFYLPKYAGVNDKGKPTWETYTYVKDGKTEYVTDYEKFITTPEMKDSVLTKGVTTDYSNATKQILGKTAVPDLTGGLGWTLSWKGLTWSTLFSYGIGGYGYDYAYATLMNPDAKVGSTNMHVDLKKAWRSDNKNTNIPILTANGDPNGSGSFTKQSDFFLTRKDYLSLANTTISYNLPKKWVNKIKLENANIYFSADNLFLLTRRKGYTPNLYASGSSSTHSYFPMTTFVFGIKVKL